jgi:hypothetical protein
MEKEQDENEFNFFTGDLPVPRIPRVVRFFIGDRRGIVKFYGDC